MQIGPYAVQWENTHFGDLNWFQTSLVEESWKHTWKEV